MKGSHTVMERFTIISVDRLLVDHLSQILTCRPEVLCAQHLYSTDPSQETGPTTAADLADHTAPTRQQKLLQGYVGTY